MCFFIFALKPFRLSHDSCEEWEGVARYELVIGVRQGFPQKPTKNIMPIGLWWDKRKPGQGVRTPHYCLNCFRVPFWLYAVLLC